MALKKSYISKNVHYLDIGFDFTSVEGGQKGIYRLEDLNSKVLLDWIDSTRRSGGVPPSWTRKLMGLVGANPKIHVEINANLFSGVGHQLTWGGNRAFLVVFTTSGPKVGTSKEWGKCVYRGNGPEGPSPITSRTTIYEPKLASDDVANLRISWSSYKDTRVPHWNLFACILQSKKAEKVHALSSLPKSSLDRAKFFDYLKSGWAGYLDTAASPYLAIDGDIVRKDPFGDRLFADPAIAMHMGLVWVPTDPNPFKAIVRLPTAGHFSFILRAAKEAGYTFDGYPIDLTWDDKFVPKDLPANLEDLHIALCEGLVSESGTIAKTTNGWRSVGMHGHPLIGE